MPRLTLLTDASVCSESRCGGWGAAMVGDELQGDRIRLVGSALKGNGWETGSAEMWAVAHALQLAERDGLLGIGLHVNIVGDNQSVVTRLSRVTDPDGGFGLTPCAADGFALCADIVHDTKIRLTSSKVKAHALGRVPAPSERSWAAINHFVDCEARRHMRTARDLSVLWSAPKGKLADKPVKIDAASTDPFGCLSSALRTGFMEMSHVRWALERLVVEERERFPLEHARLNFRRMKISPPPHEHPMGWLRRNVTPGEAVSAFWDRLNGVRNLMAARHSSILLACPAELEILTEHMVRHAKLTGRPSVEFSDRTIDVEWRSIADQRRTPHQAETTPAFAA